MFFAYITSVFIVLGFLYLIWLKVVKPLLESHGVEVDEEKPIETDHTKNLEKTKDEHAKKSVSVKAVKEELELKKDIDYFDDEIDRTKKEMKK
jgi:hypothetical protein